MTYSVCCELMGELETLTERSGTGEEDTATLVDKAYLAMEDLAQTFHSAITETGVLPRELNDMRLRLTKLETELHTKYFNNADKGEYAQVLSDFYTHYGDIMGLIGTAMETKGMDYDQPHVLTWKRFMPLRDEEEKLKEE